MTRSFEELEAGRRKDSRFPATSADSPKRHAETADAGPPHPYTGDCLGQARVVPRSNSRRVHARPATVPDAERSMSAST